MTDQPVQLVADRLDRVSRALSNGGGATYGEEKAKRKYL